MIIEGQLMEDLLKVNWSLKVNW